MSKNSHPFNYYIKLQKITLIAIIIFTICQPASAKDDLFKAIVKGDVKLISTLLKNGKNPNAKDSIGTTPLWVAAGMNNIDIMKVLLDGGADVGIKSRKNSTPLWMATRQGHLPICTPLIEKVRM